MCHALSAHQPSALTCGLPTARPCFASCTSSPTNNAPASQPACTQEQGSPARPQAYLRSAKLWDRAAQRSVPGHGLFDSPLHHPARAREAESVRKSETERDREKRASSAYPPRDTLVPSMRISQRATLRVSPAPHRHRRAQAQLRDRTA